MLWWWFFVLREGLAWSRPEAPALRRASHIPPRPTNQEREEAGVSDWDRFARQEYMRLAVEDDADVDSVDAAAAAWGGSALEVDL